MNAAGPGQTARRGRDDPFGHRHGPWAIVTGASDGIGRAIASDPAGRGLVRPERAGG